MNKLYRLVFILVMLFTKIAYSQADSVLAYIPLAIGNQWQYKVHYVVNNSNIDTIFYSLFSVINDTIMSNGYHYKKLASNQETTFVHIDSATACVYEYEYNELRGFMTDSLRCSEGDWFGENIYCELIDTSTILNYNTWIMIINRPWPDVSETHTLAMNVGMVNKEILSTIGYGSMKTYELVYAKINGNEFGVLVNVQDKIKNGLTDFTLSQNYPNPFNPTTIILYQIPKNCFVTLKVYDVLGNEIKTLVNEEKSAGNYDIEFNPVDLSSGIYLYKLTAESYTETKKMIFLK